MLLRTARGLNRQNLLVTRVTFRFRLFCVNLKRESGDADVETSPLRLYFVFAVR